MSEHTEPAKIVASPPMRSANRPQIWRLTIALPSRTDSISAPCVAPNPRSEHNATMWADGIAIRPDSMKPGEIKLDGIPREWPSAMTQLGKVLQGSPSADLGIGA